MTSGKNTEGYEKNLDNNNTDTVLCTKCNDKYWIMTEEGAIECECLKKRNFEKRLEESNIGEEFKSKKINNYDAEITSETAKALMTVYKYTNNFKEVKKQRNNGLLLCGDVGTGKTHLAVATANKLIELGHEAIYMPYRDEVTSLKQLTMEQEEYTEKLRAYQNTEILIIDDLFKGKITEADINIIYSIIDKRYFKGLPTIITTEKNIEELIGIDEAIGSRIYEMSKGNLITFKNTPNYRLRD